MEVSLRKLYANNEKLLAVDRCRRQLEEEVIEAKKQYADLRSEHMDLNIEMKNLAVYSREKLQTDLINDMNQQKEDLIANLKTANARTERYKEKRNKAEEEAMKYSEELKKAKETVKAKERELLGTKDELSELNELHKVMIKNFDDCKEETREFGESNKDLSERIASIQVEWRIERESVNERINKIKAENKSEIEQAEIEVQKSKDNVKEQIRKTQKMRKGYEIEKEQNLEIIQTIKDENNELKNKLKTKEECIK